MTHRDLSVKKKNRDRAATTKDDPRLHLTMSVADGEYNRDVTIDADDDGIDIDGVMGVSWDWLKTARRIRSAQRRVRLADKNLP